MLKDVFEYFSDWSGWFCEVEDKDGNPCGEVIESTTKVMIRHLKEEHNIEAKS